MRGSISFPRGNRDRYVLIAEINDIHCPHAAQGIHSEKSVSFLIDYQQIIGL